MDQKYFSEIKARANKKLTGKNKFHGYIATKSSKHGEGVYDAIINRLYQCEYEDIPALIAEVERLTAENQCDMHNLAAMQTTLNQQAKNCEELIESYKKSNLEQATENYELENENDRLKESMQKNKAAILRPSHIPLVTT